MSDPLDVLFVDVRRGELITKGWVVKETADGYWIIFRPNGKCVLRKRHTTGYCATEENAWKVADILDTRETARTRADVNPNGKKIPDF